MEKDERIPPTTAGEVIGNEWWEIQEKVFTRWANTHLENRNIRLPAGSMLRGALDDGMILWQLIAEISGKEEQMEKYNRRPAMRIHKVNNLLVSLNFLMKEHIKLVGIGAEDLADRKIRQILGLIWTLIFKYQVQKDREDAASARKSMLDWLNSIGLPVRNLTNDWTDGKNLCKLLNILRPGLIPDHLITNNPLKNTDQAIDSAYDLFEIPKVIDASDMVEHPDEKVNMMYLSYFRDKWDELRNKPSGILIGPNPRTAYTKKPLIFQLDTLNVQGPRDIKVTVTDENGNVLFPSKNAPIKVRPAVMEGIWDVEFTPTEPGKLTCEVIVGNDAVRGCPLIVNVKPSGFAKIVGPKRRTVVAEEPVEVKIEARDVSPSDLKVSIRNENGDETPVKVTDNKDGTISLSFTPLEEGTLFCDVNLDGEPIEGSPLTFDVEPAPSAKLVGPSRRNATAKRPFTFDLDVINLHPRDLNIKIKDPSTKKAVPAQITDNKDGTFTISLTPQNEGELTIDMDIKGKPVAGAPLKLDVAPAPWAKIKGPNHLKATTNKPVSFDLDVINLKPDELECKVRDSMRHPFPGKVDIKDNKNGTFTVSLVPTKEGELSVDLRIDGHPIEGGPVKIDVEHEPWAKLNGPSKCKATASKPFTFKLDTINVKPDDLGIKIKDGNGKTFKGPIDIKDTDKGLEVTFTPDEEGKLKVDLDINGKPVEGAPLSIDVAPAPFAKIIGNSNRKARAKKAFGFAIEVVNITPDDLEIKIRDEKKRPFPGQIKVRDGGKGTFAVGFIPEKEGELTVEVFLEGKLIEGAPLHLDVESEPWAKLVGPQRRRAEAQKPFTFKLNTVNVKPDDLQVNIHDKDGNELELPIKVEETPDGLNVTFTPEEDGQLKVDLALENKPIEGAPLIVDVDPAPWARVIGPPNRHAIAKKPFSIELDIINLSPKDLQVTVKDKSGKPFKPQVKVIDNEDGTFSIGFTPEEEGNLLVELKLDNKPIEGAPIHVAVAPAPSASLKGPSRRTATAKKPFTFHLDTVNLKPDLLNVGIKDSTGRPFTGPVKIDEKNNGFDITFVPEEEGTLKIDLDIDGEPIKGAPLIVDVEPEPWARIISPKEDPVATKPKLIKIETVNVRPEDLDVKIKDHKGRNLPYTLEADDNGLFNLGFTPKEEGSVNLDIKLDGKPIEGCPLSLDVSPAPYAEVLAPEEPVVAKRPFKLKGIARNVDPNDINFTLTTADGKKIPAKVINNGDETFTVKFTPNTEGPMTVTGIFEGKHVTGSPLTIDVNPTPHAGLIGPSFIKGRVNEPTVIALDTQGISPDDLQVKISDEDGKKVPFKVTDKGNGRVEVSFVPKEPGKYRADINLEGEPIDGTPISIDVDPAWGDDVYDVLRSLEASYELVPISDIKNLETNAPVIFQARPLDNKPSSISEVSFKVNIRDRDKESESFKMRSIGNGVFELSFKPVKTGPHTIDVNLLGNNLKNCPLTIYIDRVGTGDSGNNDKEMKISFNVEKFATVGEPFVFEMHYKDSEPHLITCDVKSPDFQSLNTKIEPGYGSKLIATTIPKFPGTHKIFGFYAGCPISGGAIVFEVSPAPYAKLVGPSHRNDATLSQPYTFQIASVNVRLPQLVCGIRGPKGKVVASLNLDPTGRDSVTATFSPDKTKEHPSGVRDGIFAFTFTPKSKGQYTCSVFLNRKNIDGGPLVLDVTSSSYADEADGETKKVLQAQPNPIITNVTGNTTAASSVPKPSLSRPGQLSASTPATVKAVPVAVKATAAPVVINTTKVNTIQPSQQMSAVTYVDQGQGFQQVGSKDPSTANKGKTSALINSAAAIIGSSERSVSVGEPLNVEVATKNVTHSQISVSVRDEWNKSYPAKIKQSGDNTYTCTFTPMYPGDYILGIFVDDNPVGGSPVMFIATDSNYKPRRGSKSAYDDTNVNTKGSDDQGVPRSEPRNTKKTRVQSSYMGTAPKLDMANVEHEVVKKSKSSRGNEGRKIATTSSKSTLEALDEEKTSKPKRSESTKPSKSSSKTSSGKSPKGGTKKESSKKSSSKTSKSKKREEESDDE